MVKTAQFIAMAMTLAWQKSQYSIPTGNTPGKTNASSAARFNHSVIENQRVMASELQAIARACGKNAVHNLETEDMVAPRLEAAAMSGMPLARTN